MKTSKRCKRGRRIRCASGVRLFRSCGSGVAAAMLAVWLAAGERAQAAPITADQAVTAVNAWIASDGNPLDAGLHGAAGGVTPYFETNGVTAAWYVVTLKPAGYAIVAADDAVSPLVLGFSATGYFDAGPNNGFCRFLRNDLPKRLAEAQAAGIQAAAAGAKPAVALYPPPQSEICRVLVPPILTSRWDLDNVQGAPCYNYYTPGNLSPGDVALCVAQTVRLHRQEPPGGVGRRYFVCATNSEPAFLWTQGGDGVGGPYDWDAMVGDPAGTDPLTGVQRQAIGALCSDASVALGSTFDRLFGTFSDPFMVPDTLSSTFGFASGGVIAPYNGEDPISVTNAAIRMINPNLDAGFPVFVWLAQDGGGGYVVTCDGYGYSLADGSYWLYHHLNFALGGADDIWYVLPEVKASASYTNVYNIIYNVMPTNQGEIVSGRIVDQNAVPGLFFPGNVVGMSMPGITVQITDSGAFTNTTVTGPNGIYSFVVPPNRTYTVTPVGAGMPFTPGAKSVVCGHSSSSGCGNVWGVDFVATSHAVGGRITRRDDGTPLAGVSVVFSGLQSTLSDTNGNYAVGVPDGWSGTVTAWQPIGGLFSPPCFAITNSSADRVNNDFVWTAPTLFAIAGSLFRADTGAAVSNVVISFSGCGVTSRTDVAGDYVAYVPTNWSGTATASHVDGGSFFPASRGYTNLIASTNYQYYYWLPPQSLTVAGRVIRRDTGEPVSGATIQSGDGLSSGTADDGSYSLAVPYLWSGTLTPSHPRGGMFLPGAYAVPEVHANVYGQIFQWTAPMPVITGHITYHATGTPVMGAVVRLSGGSYAATTDVTGAYSLYVPRGWSGSATPSHPVGGGFMPSRLSYVAVLDDMVNQDYQWVPPTLTISGRVVRADTSAPLAGATIALSDGSALTNTDTSGGYILGVPFGWSGSVSPSYVSGGTFSPTNRSYLALSSNRSAEGFVWYGPVSAALNVLASPASRGTASGSGTYLVGTLVKIAARPYAGSRFLQWQDGNTNAMRGVVVPAGGATYTATFADIGPVMSIVGALDFGDVLVNKSVARSFLVGNSGTAAFNVYAVSAPVGFTALPAAFTLRPAAWRSMTVNFLAYDTGYYTGLVQFATYPQVSGTAAISIQAHAVTIADWVPVAGNGAFGEVLVGQTASNRLVASNASASTITLKSVSWVNGTDFALTGLPVTLKPGASAPLTLKFAPKQAKVYTGVQMRLLTDATSAPLVFALSGTGDASVAGTWTSTLTGTNLTLYLWQTLGVVDGVLTCKQNRAISDQFIGFLGGATLTGTLVNAGVTVGGLSLGFTSTLTGSLTRVSIGTNRKIAWSRTSTTVPPTILRPVRPSAGPKSGAVREPPSASATAPATVSPELDVTLFCLAPLAAISENDVMLALNVQDGRVQAVAPALDALGTAGVCLTAIAPQGPDANGNGLPDAIEAALGAPLRDGMTLLILRRRDGYIVAEAPFAGTIVLGPAVPLGALPATWSLVPASGK